MEFKLEKQDVNIILQALESLVIPVKESVVVIELIKNIMQQRHSQENPVKEKIE